MILALILIFTAICAWVALAAFGLYDLLQPDRRVRSYNKNVWAVLIILGSVVGVILYFGMGREVG